MTKKELEFLIQEGEGYNLEFKESYNSSIAKEICALANASGGKILIGVTDDGKIKPVNFTNKLRSEIMDLVRNFDPSLKVTIEELDGVVIIHVPQSQEKPHSTGGRFYVRQGANSQQLTRNEIRSSFFKEGLIHFDEIINEKFDFDKDFNKEAYERFLDDAGIKTKLKPKDVLRNMELMEDDKFRNAGVLLFCKQISKFVRGGTITCALFMGKTKTKVIDSKEFVFDLYANFEQAMDYFKSHLRTEYIIKGGGPRKEILELPEEALREAVLNAIAHRDYFSTANTQISIYADRVVIDNPGGLMNDLKVEDLFEKSHPRNKLLFGLTQRMDLVERIGSGLMRINEMMEEYLLPHPIIHVSKAIFSITFERPDLQKMSVEQRQEIFQSRLVDKLGEKLVEKQVKILSLIGNNPKISIQEIAEDMEISNTTVDKHVKKLKEMGIIQRIGPAKGGYWEVLK